MDEPTSSTRRRLDSLTGLRFFAAFVVFGYHGTVLLTGDAAEVSSAVFGGGQSGVSFFFILSGFVLAWASSSGNSTARFYWRRFARIYPAYFVSLIVGLGVVLLSNPIGASRIWAPLLMVQAWIPNPDFVLAINIPAWSLSCEAFFYLIFPLAIALLSRTSRTQKLVIAAGLLVLVFGFATVAQVATGINGVGFLPDWFAIFFPVARLPEFLLGAILGLLLKSNMIPFTVPYWPAVALSLGALAWASADSSLYRIAAVPTIPFLLLICAAAQRDKSGRETFFSGPAVVRLGNWSYSFYLVHVFCIGAVHTLAVKFGFDDLAGGFAVWAIVLVVSIIAAAALHHLIELPVNRLLTRKTLSAQTAEK